MENGWIIPVHRKNFVLTVFIFVYYMFCILVPYSLQSTEVFHVDIPRYTVQCTSTCSIICWYPWVSHMLGSWIYHMLMSISPLDISFVGIPGYSKSSIHENLKC
jgi:hypothetical protein